jgi:hypothetical protein
MVAQTIQVTKSVVQSMHKEKTQQESNRSKGYYDKARDEESVAMRMVFRATRSITHERLERLNAKTAILFNRYSMRVLFQVSS